MLSPQGRPTCAIWSRVFLHNTSINPSRSQNQKSEVVKTRSVNFENDWFECSMRMGDTFVDDGLSAAAIEIIVTTA